MLPTKGYFQDIDCPYYDSQCGRPYCHFRHKRKQSESGNDSPKECEVLSYKPTPKSQLANNRSHIPISYVPDLAFRPERTVRNVQKLNFERPIYKPTPLSILSSANKHVETEQQTNEDGVIQMQQNIANTEYKPINVNSDSGSFNYTPTLNNSQSCELLPSNEYKPVGENHNNLQYNPTNSSTKVDDTSETHYVPSGGNPSEAMYSPTNQCTSDVNSTMIDFEDFHNEFDMIDEIISDSASDLEKTRTSGSDIHDSSQTYKSRKSVSPKSDKSPPTQHESDNNDFNNYSTKTKSSKSHEDKKSKDLESNREKHHSTSKLKHHSSATRTQTVDLKHHKKENRKHCSKNDKKESSKSDRKHSSGDKKENSKVKKKSWKEDKESSKDERKRSSKDSGRDRSKDAGKESSRHERKKSSKDKEKDISKGEKKESSKDVEKIRLRNEEGCLKDNGDGSSKDNEKAKQEGKSQCDKKKTESKKKSSPEDKHRTDEKLKDKDKRYHNSKERDKKEKEREKHRSRKSIEKIFKSRSSHELSELEVRGKEIESNKNVVTNSPTSDDNNVDFEVDDDIDGDDDTLQECYRIFNEYKPPETKSMPETSVSHIQKTKISEVETASGKKRIAHTNAEKIIPKIQPVPPSSVPSAAQAMTNRFKLARLAQASNEQNNIMSAVKNIPTKRSAPSSLMAAMRNYKIQKTIRDTNVNSANTSLVDQIINKSQTTNNAIAKFSQRKIAPVSNVLSFQKAKERIEEIKQKAVDSSKRTIAKTIKDGKRVAHMPEFSLAEIPDVLQADKSKLPVNVRTRFLTMIAEECGKLYLTKEDAYTRALNEEFSCYEKCKVLITYKNSAMLAVNRIRKEHQEREKQGLGPIYSGEESATGKVSEYSGKRFYDNIKQYVLSDEDLDVHGYPRESNMPGKAVIKNRKLQVSTNLKKYERKCARCSKIYVVDEDGFAFYEEECIYHPLKKRTLRGEQTYLCCKSSDDMGCVTSHTHVSECTGESELEGYQTTMEPESDNDLRSFAVYALDCEMCYTTKGLELTRVTVVDSECKTVYDSLVKPLNPVIDYNTRFSGITKDQMDKTSTSILQVQANILHLCNSETILIGHSLESDLKALKIIHGNIIDTSVLFPHRLGLPHKRALRALASEYLKKIIQNDVSGHDSAEDAITCMELIKWKLKEELKVRNIK